MHQQCMGLVSFSNTAAEKNMQNVDVKEFGDLCREAAQRLGQKISDVERMITFYS